MCVGPAIVFLLHQFRGAVIMAVSAGIIVKRIGLRAFSNSVGPHHGGRLKMKSRGASCYGPGSPDVTMSGSRSDKRSYTNAPNKI